MKIILNINKIKKWLLSASNKYSHMILVNDSLNNKVIPFYVLNSNDVMKEIMILLDDSYIRILEIYNLYMDLEEQLNNEITFNL